MALENFTEPSNLGVAEVVQESSTTFVDIKPLIYENGIHIVSMEDFQGPGKLHIGMLSISLIVGVAYGGYVGYMGWREKTVLLSHIRNLVIALTCRTFFSVLFEGVIILESPLDVDGGNTLLSFECICLNLVHAYWLVLTLYLHARVQRNFNNEPSLTLYVYGLPGLAVYFALVWIFAMEGTHSSQTWWLIYHFIPFYQWVVNSLRLLFLLGQLALLCDIGRMMMVKATDNDSVSLLRKIALMMGVLVLLFWLQFGLSVGRPPLDNIQPYLYFYYLIDGTQCLFVCIVLFFFNMWVPMILDKLPNVMENEEMARTISASNEGFLRKHSERHIVTLDSVFMTQESKKWTTKTSDGHEDVVYSSVVKPENLQKTIDLYKRLNIIPNDKVTVIEGEEFYDCDLRPKRSNSGMLQHIQNLESNKTPNETKKVQEKTVKKNAFYSSKYLILDSKKKEDIPKYLQTRPWSYTPGMDTPKEDLQIDPSKSLETLGGDELVQKWLKDHSDDMEDIQKASSGRDKRKNINKEEVSQIVSKMEDEGGSSFTETIVSTVNSVIMGTLFPSENEDNLSETDCPPENSASKETKDKNDYVTLNEEKSVKECERINQDMENNVDDVQDSKENEKVSKPECPVIIIEDESEKNVKHDVEEPTPDNPKCDSTQTEFIPHTDTVTPNQDKKILTPPKDFLNDINTDDLTPQKTDAEEPPQSFPTTKETDYDGETQNVTPKNEPVTYEDLLAFRAERDKANSDNTVKDRKMKTNEISLTGNPKKLSHPPLREAEDSESFI